MPEHDDSLTTGAAATGSGWPAAGGSGDHPVLREVAEAARLMGSAEAFLSPTREYDEPHLEESDWPRDLDRPETRAVLGHLADTIHNLDACIDGIRCQHNVPDSAKPELDKITALLLDAGLKLTAVTEALGQDAGSGGPAQQAGLSFPQAPLAGPPAASERPAGPPAESGPIVKSSKP
jgi:hypothetical protein